MGKKPPSNMFANDEKSEGLFFEGGHRERRHRWALMRCAFDTPLSSFGGEFSIFGIGPLFSWMKRKRP